MRLHRDNAESRNPTVSSLRENKNYSLGHETNALRPKSNENLEKNTSAKIYKELYVSVIYINIIVTFSDIQLTNSLANLLTRLPTHKLTNSLKYSLTHSFTNSLTHLQIHLLTNALTNSQFTNSLTNSLPYSITH